MPMVIKSLLVMLHTGTRSGFELAVMLTEIQDRCILPSLTSTAPSDRAASVRRVEPRLEHHKFQLFSHSHALSKYRPAKASISGEYWQVFEFRCMMLWQD